MLKYVSYLNQSMYANPSLNLELDSTKNHST